MTESTQAAAHPLVGAKGPVQTALHALIQTRIEPDARVATEAVQATKVEHEHALECRAAHASDENDARVHKTWLAMQTAPAVQHRVVNVVLPRATALANSKEAIAADCLLADGGDRTVFLVELNQHIAAMREAARFVAERINAANAAHAEHCTTNVEAKGHVKALAKDLATLVPSYDLAAALPRGTLEMADATSTRLALARAFKEEFNKALGENARRFLDALRTVA